MKTLFQTLKNIYPNKEGGGINPIRPKKEGKTEKFRRGLYRIENNFTNYGM
jgi:hypothetical protein